MPTPKQGRLLRTPPRLNYIYRDLFANAKAAGALNATAAEPGPGNRTVTDGASVISIASDRLVVNGTPSGGTDGYSSANAFARIAGRAAIFNIGNIAGTGLGRLGWNTSIGSGIVAGIAWGATSGTFQVRNGVEVFTAIAIPTMPAPIWVILRATGGFVVVGRKLVGILATTTTSSIKPIIWTSNGQNAIESFLDVSVADLGGLWASDFGIATTHVAAPPSGEAGQQTANAHVEVTWTVVTSETLELDVRRVDANNRWIVRCSQTNSTIKLIEKNAGSETERATAAQTWTNTTSYRIFVTCDAAVITVYVAGTSKLTYSSATFQRDAIGIAVAGHTTATDLAAWPLDLTNLLPNIASYPNLYFFVIGDSKSTGTTWVQQFIYRCSDAATGVWAEAGTRIAAAGRAVKTTKDIIDSSLSALAAATPAPQFVLINLGVNDVNGDSSDVDTLGSSVWESNYGYILDALHTKWPNTHVYVMLPGKQGDATQDTKLAAIRSTYIPNVLSTRSAWAHTGPNEGVFLENGDDYATYTSDGIHPTTPGYDLTAVQWKATLGL